MRFTKDQYTSLEDQDLLSRFSQEQDIKWLGILFQRYTLLLFGVCMKYLRNEEEAKDAVQQVFEKAIRELGKYKVDYFKSWIYMVAKNHCLMILRNRHKIPVELKEQLMAVPVDEQGLQQAQQKETILNLLMEVLPQLNVEQKTCVELFYLNELSYQQIAEQTGYSILQVKSYIQNGKRNLKLMILKHNTNE